MRPTRRHGEARKDILSAALEHFRSVGARGLTMAGVAGRAGVTAPAIYRHFAGKQELLRELVQQGFDLLAGYLARGLEGKDARERLLLTGDAYFDFAAEHPRYYETIFLIPDVPGLNRFPEDFQRGRSLTFQMLVDRVRECMVAGVLKAGEPLDVSLTIWVHSHGFMALHNLGRFGKDRGKAQAAYRASFARLMKGLGP